MIKRICNPDGTEPEIFGDEFGDAASGTRLNPDGYYAPSRVFGIVLSVPNDLDAYRQVRVKMGNLPDVSKKKRYKSRFEIKARRLSKDHKRLFSKLLGRCSISYAFVVDKLNGTPVGWDDYDTSERMIALLLYSIESVVDILDDEKIWIVMDDHNSYHTDWAEEYIKWRISDLSHQYGKSIVVTFESSSAGKHKIELQSTDMIAHSVFLDGEREIRHFRKLANVNVRVLSEEDSIVQPGLAWAKCRSKNLHHTSNDSNQMTYVIVEVYG